ncbi:MAG: protein CpxP [Flavobacterium sp.]|jgi:protein CpxP
MKKLIVMAFLAIGLGSFAQQKAVRKAKNENLTMEQRQEKILQKMQKDLALTPDQVLKMKDLMSKKQKEIADQRETRKSLAQEKMATRKSEMEKILTPEQFKKWETTMTERKEKMIERKAERNSKL